MSAPTPRRSWRAVAAATVATLSLTATALVAPPASAHGHHHGQGRGHAHGYGHQAGRHDYLALGDSVAFGYTPPETTPPADYADASNFVGYPEVLGGRLGLRVSNASCPGETTDSLIDEDAQSYACENSLGSPIGYRDTSPLHVSYSGSQLDYALGFLRSHPRTRLVSIDIGANDLFVCQTTTNGCTGSDFTALVRRVQLNLDTILSALRQRAHYHHRVVVLTYYSLDYGDPVGTGGIRLLNAALARAAAANRAEVADGFGAFQQAAASAGGDTCAAGLIIELPDGTCNVHPTAAGHEVLADAVQMAAGHLRHR